jgi:pyruvate formate lyase activating enzyme
LRLGGLIKTSTLDYPSKISAVVFTQGCNFSCPFCHNPELVLASAPALAKDEVLAFLKKRRPLLDGVVISGGEPTIQPDLPEFLSEIKNLGYPIKIDTNGSNPLVIENLISSNLIDYVALDLKARPAAYSGLLAKRKDPDPTINLINSIACLKVSPVIAEFRTTCVSPFVTGETIVALAELAHGQIPWYLQRYRQEIVLNPDFMAKYPDQPDDEDLLSFQKLAQDYLPCHIR